jgi:hypothetical protein
MIPWLAKLQGGVDVTWSKTCADSDPEELGNIQQIEHFLS